MKALGLLGEIGDFWGLIRGSGVPGFRGLGFWGFGFGVEGIRSSGFEFWGLRAQELRGGGGVGFWGPPGSGA